MKLEELTNLIVSLCMLAGIAISVYLLAWAMAH